MKEFPDESVTVFTVCTTCREEICLKATVHAKFKNIYQARKPKPKTVRMWILRKLLRQLQHGSILRIQVVIMRIIGGCFGNNR